MIARLLFSEYLEARVEEISKFLSQEKISLNHPDLLYFNHSSKLGIAEAKKIKEHFSFKPYSAKGRIVVLEDASNLTIEAQNALLKILEEPPTEALIILAAPSDAKLLPTILSRCQIIRIKNQESRIKGSDYDIESLLKASIEERFEYIEKLKTREEFLHALVAYFHQDLRSHPKGAGTTFLKELLLAEEWAEANVNIRAILEYLMLVMPKGK